MFRQRRLTVLSIALLLALLISAVLPVAAFADGEPPPAPPDAPAVGEAPPVAPADVPAVDPVPTDVPAVDAAPTDVPAANPAPTDVPAVDPAPTDVPAVDPAPTDVPAVDPVPTDVPAADPSLTTSLGPPTFDPTWCPGSALPDAGGNCNGSGGTTAQASFAALIATLSGGIFSGPGTIYVQMGAVPDTGGIAFSQAALPNLTDLVLQGGWNFAAHAVMGTSTFQLGWDNTLKFLNWGEFHPGANLTLNDIVITGANNGGLYVGDTSGHDSTANVTLDNVSVTNSTKGYHGAVVATKGNVTVKDSTFDSNHNGDVPGTAIGLEVVSDGNVNLNNVSASHNNGDGVEIYGYYKNNPASVLIENSVFSDNTSTGAGWGDGSYLAYTGNATVTGSTFEGNTLYGIQGDGPGTLTLGCDNTFGGNGGGDTRMDNGGTLVQASSDCGGGNSSSSAGEAGETDHTPINRGATLLPPPTAPQAAAETTPLEVGGLPGALPGGKTFVAAMGVKLMLGGVEVSSAPGGVQACLAIPAGMSPPFTMLSWNGSAWVEVASTAAAGQVCTTVSAPGTFALVSP